MISEHDRERILSAAEEFYNLLAEPTPGIEDVTLDQFVIVGITSVDFGDGKEGESPVMYGSTRRVFVQRGILETMLDEMRGTEVTIKFPNSDEADDEEDDDADAA